MNRNLSFLTAFGLGAIVMYAFDPRGGRRRRALAKDQLTRLANKTGDGLDAATRDLSNRAAGTVAEVRRRIWSDHPDDEVLVQRVRAEMGRVVSHPSAITVEAHNGTVRLCGPILSDEADTLIRAVESVPGVSSVENELESHDEPGNIPSLQGGAQGTTPSTRW
jgi:hypothetical protein